jgi:hypothetical protein
MKKAAHVLSNRDEASMFGQVVASKLRKLSPRNRVIAENRINNIFFELEMEELDRPKLPTPKPGCVRYNDTAFVVSAS